MTYNLLDEPWLPVRWIGNAPPSAVGLREILLRAHEIAELATDNPLETIALNRLLAALTASIFPGAVDEDEWTRLWEQGSFDADVCTPYLNKFVDRFDLFSPTRPFFGHPVTDTKDISPITRLLHAATSKNNAVLFSHDLDQQPKPLTFAETARAIICTQGFALSGGPQAKPFPYSHAPLVGGAFFWLRGAVEEQPSLFRALLLNLSPSPEVWGNSNDDHPTWESEKPPVAAKRKVGGIRELFTFQSRRLQVVNDSEGKVAGVRYNQGSKVEELLFHDPHLAYRSGKDGEFALRFNAGRALWQDSAIYMMHEGGTDGHAPRTLNWLSRRKLRQLDLNRHTAFAVDVFGMVNDQAKVELWRHERVTVYPEIITDESRWLALQELLKDAGREKMANKLREATRAYAVRARSNKPWGTRLGDIERADCDAFMQMLGTDSRYWLTLGSQFDSYLARIATHPIEELANVRTDWQKFIWKAAQTALNDALHSLAQNARTWQALAEADTVLQYGTLYPKKDSLNPQTTEPA